MGYLDCWISVATALFSQALAGDPTFNESLPKPVKGTTFGFESALAGDEEGRFVVVLEGGVLESPLFGEGVEQKSAWSELLREVADAAAGDLLPKAGKSCHVEAWKEISGVDKISSAFELHAFAGTWSIFVRDETHAKRADAREKPSTSQELPTALDEKKASSSYPALDLLLDVEMEAALRFGCRELPLGEILELGAGDVVELDRQVSDPVDLIVGDRIVARGEVILIDGNFGLRVTEVATPRKRLESIRCLF